MKKYKQPVTYVLAVESCLMNVVSSVDSNLSDDFEYGGTGDPSTDQRSRRRSRRHSVWDEEEDDEENLF